MSVSARPARKFDLEKLLYPISVERPAGESLRYEGTYDRVREARREDDAGLSQGIYVTELKKADWATVERVCLEALETRSKDLQLAAWLLEAWLHLHGFAGVAEGLKLIGMLCESFWQDLHPQIENGDAEHRFAPLNWVNEKLSLQLKHIPVTAPETGEATVYCWADWESACQLEQLIQKEPKQQQFAEARDSVTTARFQSSVMLSPKRFYVALDEDLRAVTDAVTSLEKLLDELCGAQAPGFHRLRELTRSIQHLVVRVLQAREDEQDFEPMAADAAEAPDSAEPETGQIWSGGPIRSRAEAYRRLSEVAEYLLRTEPHSPTPYLLKRAVAWGSMSLSELLPQIIRNESELQELDKLLQLIKKQ